MEHLWNIFYSPNRNIDKFSLIVRKRKEKVIHNFLTTVIDREIPEDSREYIEFLFASLSKSRDLTETLCKALAKRNLSYLIDLILGSNHTFRKDFSKYISTVSLESLNYLMKEPFIFDPDRSIPLCISLGNPDIVRKVLVGYSSIFRANLQDIFTGIYTINSHQSFYHVWFDLFGLEGVSIPLRKAIIKAIPDFRTKLISLDPSLDEVYKKVLHSQEMARRAFFEG